MGVRAVVFDIGGVFERVGEPTWGDRWRTRLEMERDRFAAALADALELSEDQADEFLAEMWEWYCGEPDQELIDHAAALRPSTAPES